MLRYKNLGYTIEIDLPPYNERYRGYTVLCTYRYDKSNDKYLLHMWLKYESDIIPINRQKVDTQYISGNKDTIRNNILKIVEQASESGFFDEYVERFENYMKCFTKGNNFYEDERMNNDK